METDKTQPEDLTRIRGIGVAVQSQLREVFGVQTFAELSRLEVADVEAALKADKSIPAPARSPNKIEQWLAAAQELAAAPPGGEERPSPPAITQQDAAIPTRGTDWEPIASFVVEFQSRAGEGGNEELRTAVHHMETDRGTHWPGVEQAKLCAWMTEKARLDDLAGGETAVIPSLVPATVVELAPVTPADLPGGTLAAAAFSWEKDVQARWVAVSQNAEIPAIVDLAGKERAFLAHVHHTRPLDLQFNFALLSGEAADTPPLTYRAFCQLNNLAQERRHEFVEMELTRPTTEQGQITASLSTISLEPGIYEVGVLMRGERPLGSHYFRFPKLNVL